MRFEVLTAVAMKIAVCWFNTVEPGRYAYHTAWLHISEDIYHLRKCY